MDRILWQRRASRLHRWLALILGIQIALWFVSGTVMALLPIGDVRGEHLVSRDGVAPLPAEVILGLAGGADAPAIRAEHYMLLDRPVVLYTSAAGAQRMHDAQTGAAIHIGPALARQIAEAGYKPGGGAAAVWRVTANGTEYRGPLPAFRVDFADDDATRVFVDGQSGKIVAVRTGTWRLFDLMWGLHIMDWKARDNFNTVWLQGFAGAAVVLTMAGLSLLWLRHGRRRRKLRSVAH